MSTVCIMTSVSNRKCYSKVCSYFTQDEVKISGFGSWLASFMRANQACTRSSCAEFQKQEFRRLNDGLWVGNSFNNRFILFWNVELSIFTVSQGDSLRIKIRQQTRFQFSHLLYISQISQPAVRFSAIRKSHYGHAPIFPLCC